MWKRMGTIAAVAIALSGCSNLRVKKVPIEKRIAGQDHIDGFRYYLSRPYVFVYQPIKVSERKSLVVIPPSPPPKGQNPGAAPAGGMTIRFLDGPRKGQTVAIKDLNLNGPIVRGAVKAVLPEELNGIRAVLQAQVDANVKRAAATNQDPPPGATDGSPPLPAPMPMPMPMPGSLAASPPVGNDTNQRPIVWADTALDAPPPVRVVSASGGLPSSAMDVAAPMDAGTTPDTSSLPVPDLSTISTFSATTARTSAKLNGPIQIVFLPDLDEQYAIKSRNLLAKTAFGLVFKEGWQLTDVTASHDSTAVALAVLDTIDAAVNAALGKGSPGGGGAPAKVAAPQDTFQVDPTSLYYLYETVYIKPGVYRLNKPWEMEGPPEPVGCGLLAKLGLTLVQEAQLLTTAEAATRDAPPAKPAATQN